MQSSNSRVLEVDVLRSYRGGICKIIHLPQLTPLRTGTGLEEEGVGTFRQVRKISLYFLQFFIVCHSIVNYFWNYNRCNVKILLVYAEYYLTSIRKCYLQYFYGNLFYTRMPYRCIRSCLNNLLNTE